MENIDKIKCILMDFEKTDKTLDEAAKEIVELNSVKCSNCYEMVVMVSKGVFCPSCYC